MRVKQLHSWQVSISDAVEWQQRLATRVSRINEVGVPRFIAGVDIAVGRGKGSATAAVVVMSYPGLELVETRMVQGMIEFPYVPGLLSFRESPLTLMACEQLDVIPDLFLIDGQGIAHPRRLGLASHLGLFLDKPTIGCAKSRLCGSHEMPGLEAGSYTDLVDDGETIGVALRTRAGVKPLYVSIGHKVDLPAATHWVLACCRGYRLPEPTRLAHLAAGGTLKSAGVKIG
ncbi:MAG: deoxyribonuclease V [Chloroflexi bacterium]|nr:deoxyribonuclease V [Chloroflexota bacterium]